MLKTALEFLKDELNLYVKRKDPVNFGNADTVTLSSLMKPDGTTAITIGDTEPSKIVITLINLEEDRIAEASIYRKVADKIQVINPPININAFVLFSVYVTNYPTALRLLSYIISFFQANTVFDNAKYPQLNLNAAKPWEQIDKMLVTMHSTTFEQQNNLWAALGAKYVPSVIYKIRTIFFTDFEPKMEAPPITEVRILDNS
jgi:hypothetical protein